MEEWHLKPICDILEASWEKKQKDPSSTESVSSLYMRSPKEPQIHLAILAFFKGLLLLGGGVKTHFLPPPPLPKMTMEDWEKFW